MDVSAVHPAASVAVTVYAPSPPKQLNGPKQSVASAGSISPRSLDAMVVKSPVPPVAVKQIVAMSSVPQRLSCVSSALSWISAGDVKANNPVVSRQVLEL